MIEQYKERGSLEPGLVTREKTAEELAGKDTPDNGLVELEVYEYRKDRIYFRILNGTNESVAVRDSVKLIRNSDGEVLYNESSEYPMEVDATSVNEDPENITRIFLTLLTSQFAKITIKFFALFKHIIHIFYNAYIPIF